MLGGQYIILLLICASALAVQVDAILIAALVLRCDAQMIWTNKMSLADSLDPLQLSTMADDAARSYMSEAAPVIANLKMQVVLA